MVTQYNCNRPPALSQRYRVGFHSNQKLLWHYQHATNRLELNLFHQLILQIELILESHDQTGHNHFWECLKLFQSSFDFHEVVSTCKNSGYFIKLFWIYNWFKNPAIWSAESILVHIAGTKFFPNIEIAQKHISNYNFHNKANAAKINDQIFQ